MTVNFDLTYKRQLQDEIDATPEEHLPALKPVADIARTVSPPSHPNPSFPIRNS